MKIIKQYGLERSGTNYIKALIELNSDAIVLSILFGGKHNEYIHITKDFDPFSNKWVFTDLSRDTILKIKDEFLRDNIFYTVSIKDPYSWIVSFKKWHQRHVVIDKDFIPMSDISTGALIDKWNRFNLEWLDNLKNKNYYIVNYDKLLNNPQKELDSIFEKFLIPHKNDFVDIYNDMQEGPDTHGSKNISEKKFDRKDCYLSKKYMDELSENDIEVINQKSDNYLMSLF